MRHGRLFRLPSAQIGLAAALLILAGCAGNATPKANEDYLAAYRAKDYPRALAQAESASKRSTGVARDQAGLIAGLSAYALNRDEAAERWLAPLAANSGDPEIAGRASATMGLLAADKGKHADAVRLLTRAGESLTGDEGARAWIYAGDSYRALGQADETKAAYGKARDAGATDEDLVAMIAQRERAPINPPAGPPYTGAVGSAAPAGAKFTLQVGAFSTRANAMDAARRLGRQMMTVGVPYVVQTTSKDGKTMHALRVGGFGSRDQARLAVANAPKGTIVVPATP